MAVGRRISDGGFFATKGMKFIGGFDIAEEVSFKLLPNEYYDVVVNMAGTMPAHADMKMMPYVQSIVVGTVNLCNWIRSFPKNGNDHAVYAICKRAATDILEHMKIAEGFEPCIFRHFMVYGWHPDAYYYLNGKKKMLPWRYMIRRCINGNGIDVGFCSCSS